MIKIAIDGPAGSGKSTIAKLLSERLSINYMDTGAMYRALAFALIKKGILITDHDSVKKILPSIDISVIYNENGQRVLVNGEDVTGFIRTPEVSKGASDVAVIPEVRIKLVKTQRETAEQFDIVMDGRDIGSYVLPDAPLKFYITASPKERARRRLIDLNAANISSSLEALEQEIIARDKTDSEREFAPLKQVPDAIFLDTTNLSIEEVMEFIEKRTKEVFSHVL